MKKIKDSIMMPPPKTRTKSIFSDTSEELRKNLIANDALTNISDNSAFDEINKLIKENNEDKNVSHNNPNLNNLSHIRSSNSFRHQEITSNISEDKSSFKFNLIHYNYTGSNDNLNYMHDIHAQKNLENLKKNLANVPKNLTTDLIGDISKSNKSSNYCTLSDPTNVQEIKYFVNNMLFFIKDKEFHDSLVFLETKIQTRNSDYKNKGLRTKYFKEMLIKMQRELIAKLYLILGINTVIEKGILILILIGNYPVFENKIEKSFSDSSSRNSSDSSDLSEISDCTTNMLKRKRNNNEELSLTKL